MNRIFFLIIVLSIGLTSGYYFIVFAGQISAWAIDILIFSGNILKKYEMLWMLGFVMKIQNLMTLILAAVPIFFISGLFLIYFIKNNILSLKNIKIISSIGLMILPLWTNAIPFLCNGWYINLLMTIGVPLFMNLFYINKISSIINAPNKNVKRDL